MNCQAARRTLRAHQEPARPGADLIAAQHHLRGCPDCRRWRDAEQEWRAGMQAGLAPMQAPLAVKEHLFAALARARVGAQMRRQRLGWSMALAAMGLLVAIVAGLWWWREASRDVLLVTALTEDHLLYAARPAPAEYASDDAAAVARWFTDRVDFAVAVPRLREAVLLGERLCTLADRRVALWLFQTGPTRLSLFQMRAGGLPVRSLRAMSRDGRRYRCGQRKGVNVVVWTERDLLFALVSSLPEDEMLELASS